MREITVEEVITNGIHYGLEIMGDDFIGYKFIGENNKFWNGVLIEIHDNNNDVSSFLNATWLKENNIPYLEHDSETWNR